MPTGSSIYLCVASNNGQWTVTFDGEETAYGSFAYRSTPTPGNCTFGWSSTNLSAGSHIFEITVEGAADPGDTKKRDTELPWMVEVQNLVSVILSIDEVSSGYELNVLFLGSRNLIRMSAAVEVTVRRRNSVARAMLLQDLFQGLCSLSSLLFYSTFNSVLLPFSGHLCLM